MAENFKHIKYKIVIVSLCLVISAISFAQAKKFELSIELKCYKEYGILATLTNASGRIYKIPGTSNAYNHPFPWASILVPEKEMKDGSVKDGTPQLFFLLRT